MAIEVSRVQISTVDYSEQNGIGSKATVTLLVTGLTQTGTTSILATALAHEDVPEYLEANLSADDNMVAVKRSARMASPSSTTDVLVTIEYAPAGTVTTAGVVRGGTSLQQEQTQVDYIGNPLSVSHQWPANDPDYPEVVQTQIGEVPVLRALTTRNIQKVLSTNTPEIVAASWAGRVNMYNWGSATPGQWLCTACTSEPWDLSASPNTHQFSWEFQWKWQTWDGYAYFIDPRTGRMPANLIAGVGTIWFRLYDSKDFNTEFPDVS